MCPIPFNRFATSSFVWQTTLSSLAGSHSFIGPTSYRFTTRDWLAWSLLIDTWPSKTLYFIRQSISVISMPIFDWFASFLVLTIVLQTHNDFEVFTLTFIHTTFYLFSFTSSFSSIAKDRLWRPLWIESEESLIRIWARLVVSLSPANSNHLPDTGLKHRMPTDCPWTRSFTQTTQTDDWLWTAHYSCAQHTHTHAICTNSIPFRMLFANRKRTCVTSDLCTCDHSD